MSDKRAWERRDGKDGRGDAESNPAYDAFRAYMRVRSTTKVAEELGKSLTLITRWCSEHDWVERITEYDSYLANADVDGEVNRLGQSRDKVLDLMDKLTRLLDMVLDDHMARREPPTVRWSQAANIAAQVQRNFLLLKSDQKSSESVVRVEKLVERIEALAAGEG